MRKDDLADSIIIFVKRVLNNVGGGWEGGCLSSIRPNLFNILAETCNEKYLFVSLGNQNRIFLNLYLIVFVEIFAMFRI